MGFIQFNDSSVFLYIIALATLVGLLYLYTVYTFNYWKNLGIKYVMPVPFFGNSFDTIFRKISMALNQQQMYNLFPNERFLGTYMFRTPLLMIRDPQLINCILSKDFAHFCDRGIITDERVDLLSSHLVNLRGQKWKSLRSKLTPAFSSGKLKIMCYQLEECAQSLNDYFDDCQISSKAQDIREIMAKFATDVIGSCAFGLQFNSLKDPNSEFRKMGQEVFRPSLKVIFKFIARTIHPSLPYYLNLKFLRPEVEKFFLDFVKDALKYREEKQAERKDFIQMLIELRKSDILSTNPNLDADDSSFVLTDEVLASNAFVFFLAGFETTSSTMSFFLLELAVNPNIQDAVRKEIEEALEKHGELNYDTIKDLPYMEMVISETLRKYPIAIGLLRECTKTYQVPDSTLVIKKGTKILIPVFAVQHDPTYFTEPEQFDPERFSSENRINIKPGTYLPFGDGPRICIGLRFAMMEMKYAFCKIIPNYEFTLSERMVYPVQFKKGGSPLLAPEDGIWLNVRKRNTK